MIGKDHETPVGLSTERTPDALSGVSHRVEGKIILLLDPMGVSEKLEAGLEERGMS